MNIAELVAQRATCVRRKVGAVIVKEKHILATGYNGPPSGVEHCEVAGCLREKLKIPSGERHEICRGLHGEQNAIIQAALHGISIRDSMIYLTNQPCSMCAKMLINAGIKKIIYGGEYPDKLAVSLLEEAGVELIKYEKK